MYIGELSKKTNMKTSVSLVITLNCYCLLQIWSGKVQTKDVKKLVRVRSYRNSSFKNACYESTVRGFTANKRPRYPFYHLHVRDVSFVATQRSLSAR